MTANWAFAPVCGFDFWRVIVFSPEVLIFLFFMITDPKTVPAGRVGRVVFGLLVAVASTLLMAPQTDEFGTKVGLLAGLVVLCAARPLLDRVLPEPRSAADDLRRFGRGGATGGSRAPSRVARPGRAGRRRRARRRSRASSPPGLRLAAVAAPDVAAVLSRVPHQVDPGTFPTISVEQDVGDFDISLLGPGAQQLVLTMAENLDAGERGASVARTRASSRRSTTAIGSWRCRIVSGRRPRPGRPRSRRTRSTTSRCRSSCRSGGRTA